MILSLREIAELVGGSIEGDSSLLIQGIGALDSANSNQISYAVNEKYKDSLKNSNAGAFIINKSRCSNIGLIKCINKCLKFFSSPIPINPSINNCVKSWII